MGVPIRILHLDDSPLDAQLVALALQIEQEKLPTQLHHVQTREEFLAALARKDFDLILSDYRMPNYDGDQALKAAQQICPEIPFIMVTGELGEELVIETLKRGATDYVLKDRIFRLIPAIQRALAESENRRKKQEAERERERLLQEVQRSKGELFAIIQAMHGGVMVFDLDGNVVLVNEAQAHLLGYRNPAEIERSLSSYTDHFELSYPDGTPVPVRQWPIQRIMRGETIESSELKMKRKDNENERFFSFSGRPVKDGTGKQILSVLVTRDITERKQIDEELRQREQRLRATFDNAPLGIVEVDADDRFIAVNARTCQMLGYTREELLRMSVSELTLAEDRELSDRMNASLREPGREMIAYEKRYQRKDGTALWVNVTVSALRDQKGQLTGAIGTIEDINERKQHQETLQAAYRRNSEILESIQDAFYATDRDLRITYVNRRAEEVFRRKRDELLGKYLWDAFPQTIGTPAYYSVMRAREEHTAVHSEMVSTVLQTWVETHIYPTGDGGVSIYFRDITERKRIEEELRKTGESLRLALKAADLGTFDLDLVTGVAAHSLRHDQMFGYREAVPEWTFERAVKHILADDVPLVLEAHARAERTGVLGFEARVLWPDNTIHWIAPRGTVQYDNSGRPVRIIGVVADITERMRMESALKQSEERFHLMADNIPQLAWMADENGKIFWYNQRWYEYTGTSFEEMEGQGWQKVHHPDHVQHVAGKLKKAFETGEAWEDTFPLRGRTGEYRWFLSRAFPMKDREGRVIRWFGTHTDITENTAAQKELQRLQKEYQLLVENQTDMVARVSRDGKRLYVNKNFLTMVGKTEEEVLRTDYAPEIHPEDIARVAEEWKKTFEPPYYRSAIDARTRTVHGWRWLSWRNTALVDDNGEPSSAISVGRDVTELKEAEENLRRSRQQLSEVLESIEDAFYALDAGWRIVYVNRKAERLWKTSRDTIVSKSLWDLFPQAVGTYLHTRMEEAMRERKATQFDAVFPVLDTWVTFSIYPMADGGLSVYFRPIAEPRRVEESLLKKSTPGNDH